MATETVPRTLTVRRCQCSSPHCEAYGFAEGMFYQGSGFDRVVANRIADIYNSCQKMESPVETIRGALSVLRSLKTVHTPQQLEIVKARAGEILRMAETW